MKSGNREQLSSWMMIDLNNMLTTWEIAIGRVISACDIQIPGAVSQWHYWKLKEAVENGDFRTYSREMELERIRANHYPNAVSRLTGVFLFESEAGAQNAKRKWRKSNATTEITDVGFSAERFSIHDSNWLLDLDAPISKIAHNYWSGEAAGGEPIWEVIASGIGRVWEREVQLRCYKKMYNAEPHASLFLKGATIAFLDGQEQAGLSVPFVSYNDGILKGYIIMKDEELRNFKINPQSPILEQVKLPVHDKTHVELKVPDLTKYFFEKTIVLA